MASIQFSPMTSIFNNMAAGTVIFGSPGSGKSFYLLNIIANALIMEQKIFALDPKDDLGVISDIFPSVEYININDIIPGSLNPFKVLKDIDTNTLTSIISIICGGLTDDQNTAISPILNDFVNKYKREKKVTGTSNVSFSDVTNYLYANDNDAARTVGNKLNTHRDSRYGALLFDDGEDYTEEEIKSQFDDNSKIISLHGMNLPKSETKNLTEEQKFNSGIVFIICKMLRDILTKGNYPTLFIMDEAHIALRNPSFSEIVDDFLVLGRSLNIATILATQNATHVPASIAQLIASKFCFKSSTKEAKAFLENFYNADKNNMADFDSISFQIGEFETGNCFYIDSKNRSGFFKVTSLFGSDVTSNPLMKKAKPKKSSNMIKKNKNENKNII